MIPIQHLCVGDLLLVGPQLDLPADGVVLSGQLQVDESSLTGESLPVLKERCFLVGAGCRVAEGGLVKLSPMSQTHYFLTTISGTILVTAVGQRTAWGKFAESFVTDKYDKMFITPANVIIDVEEDYDELFVSKLGGVPQKKLVFDWKCMVRLFNFEMLELRAQ